MDPTIQCDDLAQAIATRQRLGALGLGRNALIIPAHLPFPHAGRVCREGEGVMFKALVQERA